MVTPIARTMPSGEGLVVAFPSVVTAVSDNNAAQSIVVLDAPTSYADTLPLTLTFNGQATASLSATAGPPALSFTWVAASLAAGTWNLAVNIVNYTVSDAHTLYEFLDGSGNFLSSFTLNQRGDAGEGGGPTNPTPFADATGRLRQDGAALIWHPIGSVTTTTTGLRVRVSAPADIFAADGLRIASPGGGTVTVLDTTIPPGIATGELARSPRPYQMASDTNPTGNASLEGDGTGSGPRYVLDPAVVQSRLRALSTVGAGNLVATGLGTPESPVVCRFAGTLGDAPQPAMTCSLTSSHVAINPVAVGGILPTVHVARLGTPIVVRHWWLHYERNSSYRAVHVLFPQDPPAETLHGAAYGDGQLAGESGLWNHLGGGREGTARYADGPGPTMTYFFRPLTPGTYRVSYTWPQNALNTTDAKYVVTSHATSSVLATYHADQTLAPSGPTSQGTVWQVGGSVTIAAERDDGLIVTLSGVASGRVAADFVRVERTSADNSIVLRPDDVITLDAGAAWATCQSGAASAVTGMSVENVVGGTLYTPATGGHTCKSGYNIGPDAQVGGTYTRNDLFRYTTYFMARDGAGTLRMALPTTLPGSTINYPITSANIDWDRNRRGLRNIPAGRYVLHWKGASDLALDADIGGTCTAVTGSGAVTYPASGGGWNHRKYDLDGDAWNWSPALSLTVHGTTAVGDGTYNADLTDIHILPDGMDPDNFPEFRADFLSTFVGQVGRVMDPFLAVSGVHATIDDFDPPASILTRTTPYRDVRAGILRIEEYTRSVGTDYPHDFPRGSGVAFLITTAAPHGLTRFQLVVPEGTIPTITLSDGTDTQVFDFGSSYSSVYPLPAANELVYFSGLGARTSGAGSGVPYHLVGGPVVPGSGAASLHCAVGNGTRLTDLLTIWRAKQQDMLLSLPFSTLPETAYAIGQRCGHPTTGLAAGAELWIEAADESWNTSFATYNLATKAGYLYYGGDPSVPAAFTVEMSVVFWTQAKAGWVAAGRDPAKFRRVLATLSASTGETEQRVGYLAARRDASIAGTGSDGGYGLDLLAGGHYLNGVPPGANDDDYFASVANHATVDQVVDAWEAHAAYWDYRAWPAGHLDILNAHGFTGAKWVAYESGPEDAWIGGASTFFGGARYNNSRTATALWNHPRTSGILHKAFDEIRIGGLTAFCDYGYAGGSDKTVNGWPAHKATGQPDYAPGDPTQDAIQINTPWDLANAHSVVGGFVSDFSARYSAVAPTADFTLAISGSGTLTRGATATRTVTLSPSGGFTGTAVLSASGLPSGVSVSSFSPTSLTGGGTVVGTLTLSATSSATLGAFTLTVTGTDSGDGLTHPATGSVTVVAAASPSSASRPRRSLLRGLRF